MGYLCADWMQSECVLVVVDRYEKGSHLPSDETPLTHFSGMHVYDLRRLSAAVGLMTAAQARIIARAIGFMRVRYRQCMRQGENCNVMQQVMGKIRTATLQSRRRPMTLLLSLNLLGLG